MAKKKSSKKKSPKSKINIEPLDDRVVVQPEEAEERTSGGILLPDAAKEKPQQGRIVAAGPGKLLDSGERAKPDLKVGDRVLYGKYSGSEIKVADEEYMIMRESDILAKIG